VDASCRKRAALERNEAESMDTEISQGGLKQAENERATAETCAADYT
jgi:hypothetical protein